MKNFGLNNASSGDLAEFARIEISARGDTYVRWIRRTDVARFKVVLGNRPTNESAGHSGPVRVKVVVFRDDGHPEVRSAFSVDGQHVRRFILPGGIPAMAQ